MGAIGVWLAKYAAGRLLKSYWKQLLAGLAVVTLVGGLWALHSSVWQDGYDTARQEDVAAAQSVSWGVVDAFNLVDQSVYIAKQATTKAEVRYATKIVHMAHDVFRDINVCRTPDILWRESDAYAGELAAAAGLGLVTVQPIDAARKQ